MRWWFELVLVSGVSRVAQPELGGRIFGEETPPEVERKPAQPRAPPAAKAAPASAAVGAGGQIAPERPRSATRPKEASSRGRVFGEETLPEPTAAHPGRSFGEELIPEAAERAAAVSPQANATGAPPASQPNATQASKPPGLANATQAVVLEQEERQEEQLHLAELQDDAPRRKGESHLDESLAPGDSFEQIEHHLGVFGPEAKPEPDRGLEPLADAAAPQAAPNGAIASVLEVGRAAVQRAKHALHFTDPKKRTTMVRWTMAIALVLLVGFFGVHIRRRYVEQRQQRTLAPPCEPLPRWRYVPEEGMVPTPGEREQLRAPAAARPYTPARATFRDKAMAEASV